MRTSEMNDVINDVIDLLQKHSVGRLCGSKWMVKWFFLRLDKITDYTKQCIGAIEGYRTTMYLIRTTGLLSDIGSDYPNPKNTNAMPDPKRPTTTHGTWHFGAAVSAPLFRRHRLGADRFGAGTSRRRDISAPGHFGTGFSAPDVSVRRWNVTVSDPTTSTSVSSRPPRTRGIEMFKGKEYGGNGRGCAPPQVGVWGLCPRKIFKI